MTPGRNHLEELEALAVRAATRAGAMIREKSGKRREVVRKSGGSSLASQVVTEVDFESQRLILETLEESMVKYDLGLLTEESIDDESRHRCAHFWCIDPLDGTLPFIEGKPGYSVSIALVSRDGEAKLGVIFDPVSNTLYQATHGGAVQCNGQPMHIPLVEARSPLTLVMDRSFAKQSNYQELIEKIEKIAGGAGLSGLRIIKHGGAAMNAIWVIEQAPAVYFKFPKAEKGGGSLWDYAASACMFAALGKAPTDIHGAPLKLNRKESTFMNLDGLVYASDPSLAEAVRGLF